MVGGVVTMTRMPNQPNILILMSDEQRWDALGCNGNRAVPTPAIDGLARRGTSFEHAYATYPLCCPSRMSIWTGLMPHDHHGMGNWRGLRPDLADRGLIHPFAAAGYHTIYNGKWHGPGSTPGRFGFADVEATPAVLNGLDRGRYIDAYRAYATLQGYNLVPGNIENLTRADLALLETPGRAPCGTASISAEHWLEPWQTRMFLDQLDRRPADQPFFGVCSWNAPHFQMVVPAPYDRVVDPESIELPENFLASLDGTPDEVRDSAYREPLWGEAEWRRLMAHYLGFCALIDDQVARILEHLSTRGALDNTIVVFVSDHGDMMGCHGLNKKGYPLHYEEALQVPLVMAGPGIESGRKVDGLVSLVNLMPTLAELSGVPLPEPGAGQSCAGALRGDGAWSGRSHVIAESFKIDGTESGSGMHVDPSTLDPAQDGCNLSVRTERYRYIWRMHDWEELYDHHADPGEMTNLAPLEPDLCGEFRAVLANRIGRSVPAVRDRLLKEALRA